MILPEQALKTILAAAGVLSRESVALAESAGRVLAEDIGTGSPLIKKGLRLRPYEVALLAAQGKSWVSVVRKPRVAVLSVGDELLASALAAALGRWGHEPIELGGVRGAPGCLEAAFRAAFRRADALLVSGGASGRDFAPARPALEAAGAKVKFSKVAIKPGESLLFAVRPCADGGPPRLVFGLPGEPVAALLCVEEFVRPALEAMQGYAPAQPSYHLRGEAANGHSKPKDRRQYLFCEASESPKGFSLAILRPQGSALLAVARRANALAAAPIGLDRVRPGDALDFRWLK